MDNDIAAIRKQFLDNKNFSLPIFQPVSIDPKEIYSGLLPNKIVFDKDGIIGLHHEGFANYNGK